VLVLEDPGASRSIDWSERRWRWDSSCASRSVYLPQSGSCTARGPHPQGPQPANVMNRAQHRPGLADGLRIASRLPRERQTAEPPEFVAGTLAYMAPEQTGRMNRSIDSAQRSLWRSGVTLYEIADRYAALQGVRSDGVGTIATSPKQHCGLPSAERTFLAPYRESSRSCSPRQRGPLPDPPAGLESDSSPLPLLSGTVSNASTNFCLANTTRRPPTDS